MWRMRTTIFGREPISKLVSFGQSNDSRIPTLPTFWTFNPAYAQLQNEHVWPTAWADIIQGGMKPAEAAEKAFKRAEEIFSKYPIA